MLDNNGAGKWGRAFERKAKEYGIQIDGFVISDEKDMENVESETPVYHYSEIPFESEAVLIIQTANSKEIEKKLSNSQYHWLKIPDEIWMTIE